MSLWQTIRHKESKKIRYLMTNKHDMLVTTRGGKVRRRPWRRVGASAVHALTGVDWVASVWGGCVCMQAGSELSSVYILRATSVFERGDEV